MYELIIDCTNRCVMNCIHCGTDSSVNGNRHLDLNIIQSILEMAKLFSARVYLGGGCFFCHPNWKEILNINKVLNADVVIDVPLEETVLNSIRLYPPQKYNYEVSLSLWGVGTMHDRLSMSKSFHLLSKFFQVLSDNIHISFVMTRDLLSSSENLITFISNNPKVKSYYFHRLMPTGRCSKSALPNIHEIEVFQQRLLSSLSNTYKLKLRFHHTLYSKKCTAFRERLFIDWNGNIYGCGWVSVHTKPIGNIKNLVLSEIIHDSKSGAFEMHALCPLYDS